MGRSFTFNIILILLLLTACGGGGSETTTSNSPPIVNENNEPPFKSFEEFITEDGSLPLELSIAISESLFELAAMSDNHLQQVRQEVEVIECVNDGTVVFNDDGTEFTAGHKIQFTSNNCKDKYLNDIFIGSYSVELLGSDLPHILRFQMALDDLSISSGAEKITLKGNLVIEVSDQFESKYFKVTEGVGSFYSVTFNDVNVTEKVTQINVKKVLDYAAARYFIEGSYQVNSELADTNFKATYVEPLSGYLNTYPDKGELLIEATRSKVRLLAASGKESSYRIDVDLGGDGVFETLPEEDSHLWFNIIEGLLFYDERTTEDEESIYISRASNTPFKLLELTGYDSVYDSSAYSIKSNAELSFLFSRPLKYPLTESPIFTNLTLDNVDAQYEINGAILKIRPTPKLQPLGYYQLSLTIESETGQSIHTGASVKVIKTVIAEIKAPLFAYEKSSFILDAESLSLALDGEINEYNWQQLDGPILEFEPSESIIVLQLPSIDKEYQEVAFLLTIKDTTGEESHAEFRFLILKESLNRNVLYIPFFDGAENNVFLAKNSKSFISEDDDIYQYIHIASESDQDYGNFVKVDFDGTLPDGDSIIETQWARVEHSGVGEPEKCTTSNLGELDENRKRRIISNGVLRNIDNELIQFSMQANSYCQESEQIRSLYGVHIISDIFDSSHPGFVFSGEKSPLFIDNTYDVEVTSESPELLTIEIENEEINTRSAVLSENLGTDITLAKGLKLKEKYSIDLISNLQDKVLLYFEKYSNSSLNNTSKFSFHSLGASSLVDAKPYIYDNTFRLWFNSDLEEIEQTVHVTFGFGEEGVVLNQKIIASDLLTGSSPYLMTAFRGTSCSGDGWFEVLDYNLDLSGNLERLAIDFYQTCYAEENFHRGSIRLNTDVGVDFSKFPR